MQCWSHAGRSFVGNGRLQHASWGGCRAFCSSGGSTIDFGKHRGLTFEECRRTHPEYCDWLLKQPENHRTNAFRDFISKSSSYGSTPSGKAPPSDWNAPKSVPPGRTPLSSPGGGDWNARVSAGRDAPMRGPGEGAGTGSEVISFGKHRGKSFDEVSRTDPQYAQWVMKSAEKPDAPPAVRAFAAFVKEGGSSSGAAAPPLEATAATAAKPTQRSSPATPRHEPPQRSFQAKRSWAPPQNKGGEAYSGRSAGSPTDSETVLSGWKTLGGGKYAEKTYAEVFEQDPKYCQFTVDWGMSQTRTNSWHWPFIAYVQHRFLTDGPQVPKTFTLTAQRRCLAGTSYVLTGTPVEMPRHVLEEVIVYFGGRVLTSVSSKTTYLIVGTRSLCGQDPKEGAKFSKAKMLDIPRLSVEELLDDLRSTAEDGHPETFSYGVPREKVDKHERSE